MTNDNEWGEWQIHDGKGCPPQLIGQWVNCITELKSGGFRDIENRVVHGKGASWDWQNFGQVNHRGGRWTRIIRYRIRKPRALLDLIQLIADLPAPVCPVAPMHQPMKTDGVIA